MKLPFDESAFFNIFESYNNTIWPLQVIMYLLALLLMFLAYNRATYFLRTALMALSLMWFINGVGYHIVHFSSINKAALGFGAMFVVQAFLFAGIAYKMPVAFQAIPPKRSMAAWTLIVYAMFIYPLIGYALGHVYPLAPVFGVAPCPTTIFTFGIMLLIHNRPKWYVYLIPLLWSVIGTSAAFALGVWEDLGLAVAAIIFVLTRIFGI
jgi:Family of unknown function (DUF6064)